MKTIKLIDLFIKIANGEDTPNAIKFAGKIFTHNGTGLNHNYYCGETNKLLEDSFIFEELNDEVEIIEDKPIENKKIEKIKLTNGGITLHKKIDGIENDIPVGTVERTIIYTINEIIDKINGDSNERDN